MPFSVASRFEDPPPFSSGLGNVNGGVNDGMINGRQVSGGLQMVHGKPNIINGDNETIRDTWK